MNHSRSRILPAAGLIVMRHRDAEPEILLARRSRHMAFAPGAFVFPGGQIGPDESPARAAIRECFEEANILLAQDAQGRWPDDAVLRDWQKARAAIAQGALDFDDFLRAEGLIPASVALYARWRTPPHLARQFDSHFFIASAPPGQSGAPDGQETEALAWTTAQAAFLQGQARSWPMMFPTLVKLARLAQAKDFSAALAQSDPRVIEPRLIAANEGRRLVLPDEFSHYPMAEWVLAQD